MIFLKNGRGTQVVACTRFVADGMLEGMKRRQYLSLSLFVLAFVGIQFWQTRAMPHDVPPVIVATDLMSGTKKTLPSGGKDIEILYFFAPWCGVCKVSSHNAETVARWLPGVHVTFVGLDYDSSDEVLRFVQDNHLTSDVVLGDDDTLAEWHIDSFPTYAVINGRGEVSTLSVGYSTTFGTYLRVLLAKLGV